MKTTAGIFPSRRPAEIAMEQLRRLGASENQLSLLTPDKPNGQTETVPTDEGEQPGMGKVIGGVVGGALGLSGGMPLGAAISSLLFPGVGPVLAIGFITAALVGTAGAAGGAAVGGALEDALTLGLPRDELYFYEDALSQGRTVLIFRTEDEKQFEAAQKVLADNSAESIDAAREKWWIGLRDAEAAAYDAGDFAQAEALYRKGFEAALESRNRSKNYDQALSYLEVHFAAICHTREFRSGYERGQLYVQKSLNRNKSSDVSDTIPR